MRKCLIQFVQMHKIFLTAIILWLGIVLLFFSPSVFGGKVIAPNDCLENVFRPIADKPIEEVHNHYVVDGVSQYLPYKWAIKKSLDDDGYIGWNPYTFNGTATPANTMASSGDLTNLLYAVMPFWDAWNLGIILQFYIAGVGVILLLRYYKIPIWGCLLAAVSFAFYSQFVIWIYHRWLGAMIWAPFLVWAMLKYKQRLINVPAVIFMALLWRGGHLQSCLFGFLLVVCVWISEMWKKDNRWLSMREWGRLTVSFILIGVFGALLSIDVFFNTLPNLSSCRELKQEWGYNTIFTFVTLIFPSSIGVPQTLDGLNVFGFGFFDLKFGGSIVFILAVLACFNRRAPRIARVLFVFSLLVVCTPLLTYLYSRSTVLMALGMAWLAAWQLCDFTKFSYKHVCLKRIVCGLVGVVFLWLCVSICVCCWHEELLSYIDRMVKSQTPLIPGPGRESWLEQRSDRFLSQILIWQWQNLLNVFVLFAGIYCCYRIKISGRFNAVWGGLLVLFTCAEMCSYSSSWITYSDKPGGVYLFDEPKWMPSFRARVEDASVAFARPVVDKDFLCTNHFSGYDIRIADGYETFRPQYLTPLAANTFEPENYAQAAISHILVDTKWKDASIRGWKLVMQEKDFKLFANPAYKGRYLINDETSIKENWRTCNRIHLSIPEGSKNLTVLESYHDGWKAYAGEQELSITPTERGGMYIALPEANEPYDVLLEFHMPYRKWYYSIMALTALMLVVTLLIQRRTSKCEPAQS